MLTTSSAVFKREKKRAPSVVAECQSGRSGTLPTTRQGKPPAESGAVPRARVLVGQRGAARLIEAVSTSDPSPDTETGSPTLNKREASSPERGRVGWFTAVIQADSVG